MSSEIAPLVYDEDERLLDKEAGAFLSEHAGPRELRRLRDTHDPDGFSRALWRQMAVLGWAGLLVDERYGGLGFTYAGAGILSEHCGRTLAASPLFATAIVAATLIGRLASARQRQQLLPALAAGERLCALAIDERARHDPSAIELSATAEGGGFRLDGEKCFVIDAHVADLLLVVARSDLASSGTAGLSVFAVARQIPGLHVERTRLLDSRNAATLHFAGVRVGADALLGEPGQAWPALEYTLDVARVCAGAEQLGIAGEAFARTIEYLKQRRQFGRAIGEFQALQHRAAQLFCEIELARSAVLRALRAADAGEPRLAALASVAKVKAGDAATLAVNEAVQMHGGIGMTDAIDIGLFMKRAATLRQLFGDSYYHTDRYATLAGY